MSNLTTVTTRSFYRRSLSYATIYKRNIFSPYRYAPVCFFHNHKPLLEPTFTQKVKSTIAGTAEALKEGIHDLSNTVSRSTAPSSTTYVETDKTTGPTMSDRLYAAKETVKEGIQDLKNSAYETKGRIDQKAADATTTSTTHHSTGPTMDQKAYEIKGRVEQKAHDVAQDLKSGLNSLDNEAHYAKGRVAEKTGN